MTTSTFSENSPLITSVDDLVDHFRKGEKPRERWRVGTEHEKIPFSRVGHQPLAYDGQRGIHAVLEAFRSRFGWEPVWEGENLIALTRGQASITLEPGGQLELSGAPVLSAHDTCRELAEHAQEMREISAEFDLVLLTMGRNPIIASAAMPWMPKVRYGIMRNYLPTRGGMALDMMVGTGTVQTNIDYSDERDMARKMRVAEGLAPLLVALYASSPFVEGRPSGYLSTRTKVWQDMDPDRCGYIPGLSSGDFTYHDYVEYALDVPMFFIHREGRYQDYSGRSFRKFMAEGLDGYQATLEDWALHLTTIFPQVRLKQYIELRMADVGPLPMICSFAALTRGVFYDDQALAEAGQLVAKMGADALPQLEDEAARIGLKATTGGRAMQAWALELLASARGGLERLNVKDARGRTEAHLLDPLDKIAESGESIADRLLALWKGPWGESLEPLFSHEDTIF